MVRDLIERFATGNLARQILRFALAGAAATAAHYSVLIGLVELGGVRPVVATTIGYCVGIVVSYALNRRYTFNSATPIIASFPKFAVLYGIGMVLNGAIFAGLMSLGAIYIAAQIGATAIVLFWNFLGARFVAFR
jgi:putative flippase GtrA